jgi:hypothetical protein
MKNDYRNFYPAKVDWTQFEKAEANLAALGKQLDKIERDSNHHSAVLESVAKSATGWRKFILCRWF